MTILQFFIKEIYFKIIYLILIFVTLLIILINKAKILFLYILEPIKNIKIKNFLINYQEIKKNYINQANIDLKDEIFIPIIEINLPFLTTSYIYLKYILLFSIYIFIPIFLYILYISVSNILKKNEILNLKYIITITTIYIYINYIISHYIIVPIYITFIYSHYNEFLYYEFDIEFQLTTYLNFYFQVLFTNFFLFITILIKKYFKLNIPNILILLVLLLILPFDGMIQIIYICIFITYIIINIIINNYIINIKKYK